MSAADSIVIDCDSHVMEPPDLWEKYLEPKFRDRAIRIVKDPGDGLEVLMIDNQPLLKGMLAGLGGANQPRQELFIPGRRKCCNFEDGDGGVPARTLAARSQAARSKSWSMN